MLEPAPPGFVTALSPHVRTTIALTKEVEDAKLNYQRAPGYHTALGIQDAQRDLENHIRDTRARIHLVWSR
jgi:hypothetical protein